MRAATSDNKAQMPEGNSSLSGQVAKICTNARRHLFAKPYPNNLNDPKAFITDMPTNSKVMCCKFGPHNNRFVGTPLKRG